MITLSKPVQHVVDEFKTHEALRPAIWNRAEKLGVMINVMNTEKLMDSGMKWIYANEAKEQGRFSEDAQKNKSDEWAIRNGNYMILVPMTDEEKQARQDLTEYTTHSNELYDEYKFANMIVKLRAGKRMRSKFAGQSSVTGEQFESGTEIFYANTLSGKFVAPATEVESIQ